MDPLFTADAGGPIERLFGVWQDVMERPRAKLDMNRQQRLRWALLNYTEEECEQAIRGCAASDWHMGRNSRGRKYDDIELIFRDSSHVEQFIDNHLKAETADQELAEWLMEGDQ